MSAFPRDWQPTAASLARLTHDLTGLQVAVRIYPPGEIRMLERPAVWRPSSRRLFVDATAAGLSTADEAKLRKYVVAYKGPDRPLLEKYLQTMQAR